MMGETHPSRGHVKRGEELVFCEDIAVCDLVKESALSCVGVSDESDMGHLPPLSASALALPLTFSPL